MTSYRSQYRKEGKRVAPVISIVCNFTKPIGDEPALLTFDEATTLFHEFGHALHGLLSNVKYKVWPVHRYREILWNFLHRSWKTGRQILKY